MRKKVVCFEPNNEEKREEYLEVCGGIKPIIHFPIFDEEKDMNLLDYYGKYVCIVSVDGNIFYGQVNDYFDSEDNENGLDSIVIDTRNGEAIEFTKNDIEAINIFKD